MFNLKFVSLFSTVFLCIFILIGCNGEAGSNSSGDGVDTNTESSFGELQIALQGLPPVLDTHRTQGQLAADISVNIFETLVTTDSQGNIQPMLAESWEQSENGETITFFLRKDVFFHDGKELLAEDVIASMNRWIEISGPGLDYFPGAKFEKVDDYTVNLLLPEPNSTALTILAYGGGGFPAIMPQQVIESASEEGVKEYIGTGPFQFEEWRQDQFIHLTRFKDYNSRGEPSDGASGAREALVNDIYINIVPDSSTRVTGILTGEYDVAMQLSADSISPLENDSNIDIKTRDGGNLEFYFNKKKGIFADNNARKAVALALNVEEILKSSLGSDDYYELNHHMMLKGQEDVWYSDVGFDMYNQNNIEKAKDLLEETDYNGEEITILSRRDVDHIYNSTVVLQQQLEQIGIKSKLDVVDRATYEELRADENAFDIFPVSNVPRPEPTSSVFLRKDFGGWTDSEELDDIIESFRGQKTLEDAIPIYDELQEWFWSYIPIIKVGDMKNIDAVTNNVEGFEHLDSMVLWGIKVTE